MKICDLFFVGLLFFLEQHFLIARILPNGFKSLLESKCFIFCVSFLFFEESLKILDMIFSVVEPRSRLVIELLQLDLLVFVFMQHHSIVVFDAAQLGIEE
jgi:hypothetical protein